MKEVPATERLAQALEATGKVELKDMAYKARQGYYDDFKSPLTVPCIQLVNDLMDKGEVGLAERAKQGEFDASREEARAWGESEEGLSTRRMFGFE